MYSTNLQLHHDVTLFDGDRNCVGTAYGFESVDRDEDGNIINVGASTQTAKDNALLWSLSPKLADFLLNTEVYRALNAWGDIRLIELRTDLIAELLPAIPPASVTADA